VGADFFENLLYRLRLDTDENYVCALDGFSIVGADFDAKFFGYAEGAVGMADRGSGSLFG
jgi:hypothetical protein